MYASMYISTFLLLNKLRSCFTSSVILSTELIWRYCMNGIRMGFALDFTQFIQIVSTYDDDNKIKNNSYTCIKLKKFHMNFCSLFSPFGGRINQNPFLADTYVLTSVWAVHWSITTLVSQSPLRYIYIFRYLIIHWNWK